MAITYSEERNIKDFVESLTLDQLRPLVSILQDKKQVNFLFQVIKEKYLEEDEGADWFRLF